MPVDLSRYSAAHFDRGASRLKELLWVVVRCLFFAPSYHLPSSFRIFLLRAFGARIGRGVVVRPRLNVHFPWRLEVGDHVWFGEDCYLLNLATIRIDSNVCVSQRAFLCTGNHDYTSATFDLVVKPIHVEAGAWLGAGSFVGPGVTVGTHAVLSAGSVTGKNLEPFGIYQGNPAVRVKERVIKK